MPQYLAEHPSALRTWRDTMMHNPKAMQTMHDMMGHGMMMGNVSGMNGHQRNGLDAITV
jgi:hypothetical protein